MKPKESLDMTHWPRRTLIVLLMPLAQLFMPEASYAYAGPGSVISGIGTLLAVVAAIVAAIFGFFWFPLKRLFRKVRGRHVEGDATETRPPVR
jgi:hypothetical protein